MPAGGEGRVDVQNVDAIERQVDARTRMSGKGPGGNGRPEVNREQDGRKLAEEKRLPIFRQSVVRVEASA